MIKITINEQRAEKYLLKKEEQRKEKSKEKGVLANNAFTLLIYVIVIIHGMFFVSSFEEIVTFVLGILFSSVSFKVIN